MQAHGLKNSASKRFDAILKLKVSDEGISVDAECEIEIRMRMLCTHAHANVSTNRDTRYIHFVYP